MPRRLCALATRHALDGWGETRLAGGVLPAASSPPRIADYELIRIIGSGSYGDVWLARGITGVFRAIKVVWRERFTDLRPYEREFAGITRFATVSVREPSQLALLHAGRNDAAGYFYYVMELADDAEHGRTINPENYVPLTLREVRERRGRLPAAEVVTLGVALARALLTLHAEGLVHRDIKPSNVVFVGGVPKLADVGLVTAASDGVTFVGTEGYVPREGPGAPAADVYSLGKVLYELVTGQDRNDWPRLPAELVSLPGWKELLELNEVLVRACEADVAKRFSEAESLLEELLLLQAGKSVRRLRATERRLSRALRVAAVFAVAAILGGGGAWIEHRRASAAELERDQTRRHAEYAAALVQAQGALDEGQYGRARAVLEAMRAPQFEDLRSVEWDLLHRKANGGNFEIWRATGAPVERLALAPDESMLAVHASDKTVTLFEAQRPNELRKFGPVHRLSGFSRDGRWLLGTDSSYALRRWSVDDGRSDSTARSGRVHRPLAVGADSKLIAFVDPSPDSPAKLIAWDFETHHEVELASFTPGWEFLRATFDKAGDRLLVCTVREPHGTTSYEVTVISCGAATPLFRARSPIEPAAIGWMGTGNSSLPWIANAAGDAFVADTTMQTWTPWPGRVPDGTTRLVLLGSAGSQLAIRDASITVLRGAPLKPALELLGHEGAITAVESFRNHKAIFSATNAGEVRRWSVEQEAQQHSRYQGWNSNGSLVRAIISPDSRLIYTPKDGRAVAAIHRSDGTEAFVIDGMRYPTQATEAGVWGTSTEGRLIFWQKGSAKREWASPSGQAVFWSATDNAMTRLVFADIAGNIFCLDPKHPELIRTISNEGLRCWGFDASASADRVWHYRDDLWLSCVDTIAGRRLWQVRAETVVAGIKVSMPRNEMLVLYANGTLAIHDPSNGMKRHSVFCGTGDPAAFELTGDAKRILVVDRAGALHLLTPPRWDYLGRIRTGLHDAIRSTKISRDGETLVSVTPQGIVHILHLDPPAKR